MTEDEICKLWLDTVELELTKDRLIKFAQLVAEHEREACAKVCEESWRYTASAKEMVEYIQTKGQA